MFKRGLLAYDGGWDRSRPVDKNTSIPNRTLDTLFEIPLLLVIMRRGKKLYFF